MRRAAPIALAALFFAALAPGLARAQQGEQRPPVGVEVGGLFGDDLVVPHTHAPVLVTLTNRTREAWQGTLELSVDDWRRRAERHRMRVDLPAGATRRVQLALRMRDSGATLRASYRQGRLLGSASTTVGYNASARGVVVLADPPRLRQALLDIESEQEQPYGGSRRVALPIGAVPFDPDTGDPMAPTQAVAWSVAELVVASAPDLERLLPPQRRALFDWLRSGGQLLVFPRTPEDARAPAVGDLFGPLERVEGYAAVGHFATVPEAARSIGWVAPPGARVRAEPFGVSAPVGFGRAFLATYDGAAPPHVDAPETRRAIVSLIERHRRRGTDAPLFAFGGADASSEPWASPWNFRPLRASLDPNESFRPALGLVAVVLILYVFLVGPINFNWLSKKNKPTLALVTTPLAALGCLMVLLLVGYVGKGTTMRYRSVSMLELVEGEPVGPERRYLGTFLTRPTTFELESPERGVLRLLEEGGARPPVVTHDGSTPVLEELQGGLWETLFLREDRLVEAGEGISFERSGNNLAAVVNRSELALRDAFVVDSTGNAYPVGDVPPGGRAPVAGTPTQSLGMDTPMFWGENDATLRAVTRLLGVDPERRKAVFGLVQNMGGTLVGPLPTLYARVEVPGEMLAGRFVPEMELRFVRVVPYVEGGPVPVRWEGEAQP
ncbi:MAG TPA: hypothetical protein RMH85_25585 [Polyangiaceae bacterium LLY-WYZ-15_(1-7)]|nr:hypothetical protein [Myxococcales bacterium]MAT25766.1 hypothetical protein [Sandaracinus sp.]HJK95110.1 hypothetical protein [Polyangiaceae bacterium LLY-WYZ-15_(1-7)]MBJ70752.1 hypothetical protein [Sandaracinus sp.]HJL04349.1 hypothetical protein [Polyangiaceae bacterium LLY-WYZ-15_(1-7)]